MISPLLRSVADATAAHLARYNALRSAPASTALLLLHAVWQRQSVIQQLLSQSAFLAAMFVSGFSACMLSMLVLGQTHVPLARWAAGARRLPAARRTKAPPARCTKSSNPRLRRRSQSRRLKPRPIPKNPNRKDPLYAENAQGLTPTLPRHRLLVASRARVVDVRPFSVGIPPPPHPPPQTCHVHRLLLSCPHHRRPVCAVPWTCRFSSKL